MSLNKRRVGILLHISSLPGEFGIGTLGKNAYKFIDFLNENNFSYLQVLPICPPSLGNSPYSAYSSYAANPLFIDLDLLNEESLIEKEDYLNLNWGNDKNNVDFDLVNENKKKVLKKAVNNFKKNDEYYLFEKENAFWLEDYALFMSLKDIYQVEWYNLNKELKDKEENAINDFRNKYSDLIDYYKIIQFLFYKQWFKFKEYANNKGIEIIGDIPIYVALDSADVYSSKELFDLNEDGKPSLVSGCPPDGFSAEGQKWNNPLYKWENHEKDNYAWWIKRIKYLCNIYDILRIDHFRGFESYYAIPYDKKATEGTWLKGPGMKLFDELNKNSNNLSLIAEDLGFLTDDVRELLRNTNYPGMKVLEFAFNINNPNDDYYKPHNYIENVVAYIGTHDNDTLKGYLDHLSQEEINFIMSYYQINNQELLFDEMIKSVLNSKANTVILQTQDLLKLGSEARMNKPGIEKGNWTFRISEDIYREEVKEYIKELLKESNRENLNK